MVISKSIIFQLFETVSLQFALAIKPLNLHIFVYLCLRGEVPGCVRASVRRKIVESS